MSETEGKKRKVAIDIRHVTKSYKLYDNDRKRFWGIFSDRVPHKVKMSINDFNLTIYEGEAVALFGTNGAGKSTLLKMITGVTYPTSGEIEINGRVSALLELTAGFDPEFTGRENIYFRGTILGMKEADVKKIEPSVVKFAKLGDYIDQPVRTYSSGMKARLGFAINVNIDPEILIVDEALSVGDKAFRKKCLKKVRELVEEKNVTFLFVTHSVKTAQAFCKRGIVMKKGKLRFDGPIDEAIEYYNLLLKKEELRRKKKRKKKLAEKRAREAALAAQEAALEAQEAAPEGTSE